MYDQEMTIALTTDQPMARQGRFKDRYQRHDIQITTQVEQSALSSPAK